MEKVVIKCAECGKKLAAKETSKKVRCPGCKSVIDVQKFIAKTADAKDNTEPKDKKTKGKASKPESKKPKTKETDTPSSASDKTESDDKAPAEKSKKSQLRSVRRSAAAADTGVPMVGTMKAWIVILISAFVLGLILCLLVHPLAALAIVTGIGVYVDASLNKVTRITPGSNPVGMASFAWGLFSLVPGVFILYLLMRNKLIALSPNDIAEEGMSPEDMEFEHKVHEPKTASPALYIMLILSIVLMVMMPRAPAYEIKIGRNSNEVKILKVSTTGRHSMGEVHVGLRTNRLDSLTESPITKWAHLVKEGTGDERAWNKKAGGELEMVDVGKFIKLTLNLENPGVNKIEFYDANDAVIAYKEFRVRR